jgi:RNA polymerase sigma-54 factor
MIIGNLNEDGYLTASDEELLAALAAEWEQGPSADSASKRAISTDAPADKQTRTDARTRPLPAPSIAAAAAGTDKQHLSPQSVLHEALHAVRGLDPAGVAARDLRECLLLQLDERMDVASLLPGPPEQEKTGQLKAGKSPHVENGKQTDTQAGASETNLLARRIIADFLPHLQKRDLRELSRLTNSTAEQVQKAVDLVRSLDPRPGLRYNREEARLIEPDVAFVKRDDEYVVVMNEDDMPTLRLNHGYRRMLTQENADREVKEYVKERYRSAIQLMRNIEQRKNTILRTCEVILRRQQDFMEHGVEALHPMMIKEVAEEIGVHPSTVSRAVSNKYVHTPQGVFELRFFFSEGVNGPEGADTPLLLLKRKVKKMIEEEDPRRPLTDDAITAMLQAQGINVTRRTVAKYREDMAIPSTHQRRVKG